jgi:hypothetical protein
VQVVILDDVRIGRLHHGNQAANQIRFRRIVVAVGLEQIDAAAPIAHRDQEDAIARGVETSGLEIDLHPVQVVEGELAKVSASARDQILLVRRQRQHVLLAQFAQAVDRPAQPARRSEQHRGSKRL